MSVQGWGKWAAAGADPCAVASPLKEFPGTGIRLD